MCRWLAYSGSPVLLEEVLYGGPVCRPREAHSLAGQSLHASCSKKSRTTPDWSSPNRSATSGAWNEVPESTYGVVGPDRAEMRAFQPKPPTTSVPVTA